MREPCIVRWPGQIPAGASCDEVCSTMDLLPTFARLAGIKNPVGGRKIDGGAIGPLLRERGQIFVGIDVIGDWLTEINVTSPTGIQELERFDDINVAGRIWDVIEAKRAG